MPLGPERGIAKSASPDEPLMFMFPATKRPSLIGDPKASITAEFVFAFAEVTEAADVMHDEEYRRSAFIGVGVALLLLGPQAGDDVRGVSWRDDVDPVAEEIGQPIPERSLRSIEWTAVENVDS